MTSRRTFPALKKFYRTHGTLPELMKVSLNLRKFYELLEFSQKLLELCRRSCICADDLTAKKLFHADFLLRTGHI